MSLQLRIKRINLERKERKTDIKEKERLKETAVR